MAFVYSGKSRTAESVTRASRGSSTFDSPYKQGVKLWKAKEGENTIRILPPPTIKKIPWGDKKWGDGWHITTFVHFGIGSDEGTYLCLDKMQGKRCPVCEAKREAESDEERDALRWSERPLAYIIDRNAEKEGPQLFAMPFVKVFREICTRSIDRRTGKPILIDDPEDGFDIVLTREGSGKKTQYSGIEILRDPSPLSESRKKQERWLDFVSENPLPEMLNYYSASYIEDVLFGRKERSEDDDDDDAPRSKRKKRKDYDDEDEEEAPRKKRKRVDDDDDDEDDKPRRKRRDDDDDDDEDDKPRRKRRDDDEDEDEDEAPRKKRKYRDDDEDDDDDDDDVPARRKRKSRDDDEDEDEDDDDEDERPKKKRKKDDDDDDDDEIPSKGGDAKKKDGKYSRLRARRDDD